MKRNSMNAKQALVIAGGQWQVPLIEELKSKNYLVTVVDPFDDSKGVLISDFHIKSDVRDKEFILSQIENDYDIVATDQSDVAVETVAYLADRMNLVGNAIDVVRKFSNKFLSRQYAQSIGVPIPCFCEVDTVEKIQQFIDCTSKNYILKPSDAQSSKGIHIITPEASIEDISSYLADALRYSYTKKAILEQFVTGYEITVEGFCSNGKHQVLAISRKEHFKTGVASRLMYPGNIPCDIKDKIIDVDNLYVELSGLKFGPTHAEYIINEETGEFWLVEIACRGGGTLISSDIVKWVSGFDMQKAYISSLEGETIDVKSIIPQQNAAELHFFEFGSGVVLDINGVDIVACMPEVLMLDLPIKIGDTIKSCVDDRSRQGFVIVQSNTKEELNSLIEKIEKTINIVLKK